LKDALSEVGRLPRYARWIAMANRHSETQAQPRHGDLLLMRRPDQSKFSVSGAAFQTRSSQRTKALICVEFEPPYVGCYGGLKEPLG